MKNSFLHLAKPILFWIGVGSCHHLVGHLPAVAVVAVEVVDDGAVDAVDAVDDFVVEVVDDGAVDAVDDFVVEVVDDFVVEVIDDSAVEVVDDDDDVDDIVPVAVVLYTYINSNIRNNTY